MPAYLARRVCASRAYAHVATGLFSGLPAIAAVTDCTLQLLIASEGAQEVEGQLEVVSEQPLFAAARAVCRVPAQPQDYLALLTDSGFLSILRYDATQRKFMALQQLALPPEHAGDPFRLLAVHQSGDAVAVASLGGTVCLSARVVDAASSEAASSSSGVNNSSSGRNLFSAPVVLSLERHLWSLAFVQQHGSSRAAGTAAGQAPQLEFRLAALHRRPSPSGFAVAEYQCSASSGAVEAAAFCPLDSRPDAAIDLPKVLVLGSSFSGLGLPRALVQLPLAAQPGALPWAAVVLHEHGIQLVSSLEPAAAESPAAAAFALHQWLHDGAVGAAAWQAPAGQAQQAPEPMAVSQQPSFEKMQEADADGQEDEDMPEAAGGAAASGAGAGAEDVAGTAGSTAAAAAEAEAEAAKQQWEERAGLLYDVLSGEMRSLSRPFVTCCCWEWQHATSDTQQQQQDQAAMPVLVCALEDGSIWRLPLPSPSPDSQPGSTTSLAMPAPNAAAGNSDEQQQQQQQKLAQPARSLAALPGGLLLYCSDCSGLQLLRLAAPLPYLPRDSSSSPPAASYEPLLPPFLSAQQQLAAWDSAAGGAGCCTLPAAALVSDALLADLEGAGQQQLYTACRSIGAGGSLCIIYPDPKPETVFELPGAAEGITGLWGLRRRPAERHHYLALLSYLGGSRLLAVQGGIFRDVTDCYALQASAQTLAAGNLAAAAAGADFAQGAAVVAQVTSHAVVLFSTAGSTPLSRQSSGALGGPIPSSSSSASSAWRPAWQPPFGSTIGAAAVTEQAVLLYCTGSGGARQFLVLLPAAAQAAPSDAAGSSGGGQLSQLVVAAQLPMPVDVSCISNLALLPLPLPQASQQQSAVFAVGTYASTVLLLQLRWDSQQPQQPVSLSVLHTVNLTNSSIAAGLPGGAAAAAAAAVSATPLSPRTFQREQLTPESVMLLPAADGGSSATTLLVVGLRTGGLLQLRCCLEVGQQQAQQEELLAVSVGLMPVILLPLPQQQPAGGLAAAAAGVVPPAAVALSDRALLLHSQGAAVAGGRVRCQQLALPQVRAAAPLLLDSGSLGSSSFMLDALAAAYELEQQQGTTDAAPAQEQQLFLLCAAADGCLRMVSLDPQQLASSRCLPLPQQLQPSRLTVHAASGSIVVAGSIVPPLARQRQQKQLGWEAGEEDEEDQVAMAAVQVVDPSTGDLLASYSGFMLGETISALGVWDPSQPHPAPPRQPGGGGERIAGDRAPEQSAAAAAAAAIAGTALEEGEAQRGEVGGGGGSLRSHPIAFSPESPAAVAAVAAAAAAAAGDEQPWGGFIVVGTTIDDGEDGSCGGEPRQWDDESSAVLQGRLLLLQLVAATAASASGSRPGASGGWEPPPPLPDQQRRHLQLLPVAESHLPSRVLAVCPGSTAIVGLRSSARHSAGASARLFASVGRRLVAYEWRPRQQGLRRVAWVPTNRPLCSLQLTSGLLAAADRGEGATLYQYYEAPPGSEQELLQQHRARLMRRIRLAPPGAAELQQPLRLRAQQHLQHHGVEGAAAGQLQDEIEELDPGFSVVAADSRCRPAVGSVALPPSTSTSGSNGPATQTARAPAAAAVLDAAGRLCLLQQRWPLHEPALHQRCCFQLGEPAVGLLPGSLSYESCLASSSSSSSDSCGAGTAAAATAAAARQPVGEMVAITVGGSVLSLLPLPQPEAQQLLLLQQALPQHPAAAPLSGSSHAEFRGYISSDSSGEQQVALQYRHPPLPGASSAAASPVDLLAPPSPMAAAAQQPLPGAIAEAAAAAAAASGLQLPAAGTSPAAGQAGMERQPLVEGEQAPEQRKQSAGPVLAAAVDAVLDADILQQYLAFQPAEQQQLVASMGCVGGSGGDFTSAELRRVAAQLNNLVARLLL